MPDLYKQVKIIGQQMFESTTAKIVLILGSLAIKPDLRQVVEVLAHEIP